MRHAWPEHARLDGVYVRVIGSRTARSLTLVKVGYVVVPAVQQVQAIDGDLPVLRAIATLSRPRTVSVSSKGLLANMRTRAPANQPGATPCAPRLTPPLNMMGMLFGMRSSPVEVSMKRACVSASSPSALNHWVGRQ